MLLIKLSSASVTTCLKAECLPVCWSGVFRSFTQCQQWNTSTVMKLNWRGLVLMDSTISGKNQTQHIRTKRWSRGDDLDWFGIGPGHHCLDHELLCIPESDVRQHVYQLKIVQNRVLQQVNDPKHSNKTTKKRLERAVYRQKSAITKWTEAAWWRVGQHSPTSCERLWETDKVTQKFAYFKFLTIGSTSGCGMTLGFKLQTVITTPPLPVS